MVEQVRSGVSETPKLHESTHSGRKAVDVLGTTGPDYVQMPEGVIVPFRVLHQPLGIPREHVALLQEHFTSSEGEPFVQIVHDGSEKDDRNIWIPQIIEEDISRKKLLNMVTDVSIRENLQTASKVPSLFILNVPAVELYVLFLRKYYNRPNIRLINETEFNNLYSQLPGSTNKEKLGLLGVLFPQVDGKILRIPHTTDTQTLSDGTKGLVGTLISADSSHVENHSTGTHAPLMVGHAFHYLLLIDSNE